MYGTGNAITLSQGRYLLPNSYGGSTDYEDYGTRNSYRMPAYHRLDLDLSTPRKALGRRSSTASACIMPTTVKRLFYLPGTR